MGINEDANRVLVKIAEYGKGADDPDRGPYIFEGDELTGLTQLATSQVEDAVELLASRGYAELTRLPAHILSLSPGQS